MVQRPRRVSVSTAEHQRHRSFPVRTCVGCRQRALIGELLRVVAVDGRLVVDGGRRLPGRGAWLHPGPGCLARAERKRAFPRALRVPGTLETDGVREHPAFAVDIGSGTFPGPSETRKQVDPS
ncbi:YlxR family protein [Amycolatopsis panacis]|uniref:YlxR family protein n=1 Tax=Amycolatopsis panacis TaxID=2340917 RepID=A0A419HK83_9PSEU|nr:YlxR family protein [Amycolatopsis panacis]RJQ76098.1 YlxR family protein [Amycolatopsis panacis]